MNPLLLSSILEHKKISPKQFQEALKIIKDPKTDKCLVLCWFLALSHHPKTNELIISLGQTNKNSHKTFSSLQLLDLSPKLNAQNKEFNKLNQLLTGLCMSSFTKCYLPYAETHKKKKAHKGIIEYVCRKGSGVEFLEGSLTNNILQVFLDIESLKKEESLHIIFHPNKKINTQLKKIYKNDASYLVVNNYQQLIKHKTFRQFFSEQKTLLQGFSKTKNSLTFEKWSKNMQAVSKLMTKIPTKQQEIVQVFIQQHQQLFKNGDLAWKILKNRLDKKLIVSQTLCVITGIQNKTQLDDAIKSHADAIFIDLSSETSISLQYIKKVIEKNNTNKTMLIGLDVRFMKTEKLATLLHSLPFDTLLLNQNQLTETNKLFKVSPEKVKKLLPPLIHLELNHHKNLSTAKKILKKSYTILFSVPSTKDSQGYLPALCKGLEGNWIIPSEETPKNIKAQIQLIKPKGLVVNQNNINSSKNSTILKIQKLVSYIQNP